MQRRNAQLEEENIILKKSNCPVHTRPKQKIIVVDTLRYQHTVRTICRAIKLNPSTYYRAHSKGLSKRDSSNQSLRMAILNFYINSNKRFGACKINNKMREQGFSVCIGKLYRLVSTMNLPTIFSKKLRIQYAKTTNGLDCPNIINQNLEAFYPNQVWVNDITYVKVNGRFAYV